MAGSSRKTCFRCEEGLADRDDGRVLGFDIIPEEKAVFGPLLKGRRTVKLYENDQGFVIEI